MLLADFDRRLQYGPGMRAQRVIEASSLLGAFFTGDPRLAYVALVFTALQAISPRLAPVAVLVSAFVRAPKEHRLSDIYFDFAGTRGSCAMSAFVQAGGIWLARSGHEVTGYAILAIPTASFLLSATVGFCSGCAVYVGLRDLLARAGFAKRYAHGACDIDIDGSKAPRPQ
jgi:hypothetical protein